MCSAGVSFCEGTKLWTCTRTGTDASLNANCEGGSQVNPTGCFTTNCQPGTAACCRPTKPLCRMNFSSPAISSDFYVYVPGQAYCSPPTGCAQDTNFSLIFQPNLGATTCTPNSISYVSITVRRPLTTPGQVITLPNANVSLSQSSGDVAKNCNAWTGSVTWNSEVPSWSISINATCSETGKTGLRLVGTFSGDV